MKISKREDLENLVGKTIQFTDKVLLYEVYAEPGMKAVVSGFIYNMYEDLPDSKDVCHAVYMTYTKFDEFNKKKEPKDYFDKNGVPCLTAREANLYQEVDDVNYFDKDLPFEVVEE